MWKAVLAGTAAAAIAGSTLVYAQQGGRPDGFGRGGRPTIEDMRAFADARLAALHAGLGLSADQEKNWPAFEQAARELSKLRLDRMTAAITARRDRQPQDRDRDPVERMRDRGTAMADAGAALKKLADATDPLYKSLDDGQKRRFAMLGRLMGPREGGHRGREFRRDRDDRGRDGDGPRRFNHRPDRTDFTPSGPGEERL